MELKTIRGLLIDIDDTVTKFKTDANGKPVIDPNTGSLFNVLQSAGVALGGLTAEETAARIQKVQKQIPWWHWSDFIIELGLNSKRFWNYAFERESRYLEAAGPDIRRALKRLRAAGVLLYITSNNPDDGILHKLRLAGVADLYDTSLFTQLLGCAGLQYMKWDVPYWKKVLAHIGLDGEEVAVVGDSLRDDYELPHSVGIAGTFLINRNEDLSAQNTDSLIHVQSFDQIADTLLTARGIRRGKRTGGKGKRP